MTSSPGDDGLHQKAPKLDFLWKGKKTISRDPVKIADIKLTTNNGREIPQDVIFFDDKFVKVLTPSKEAGKLIMFVDAIGMFQSGKTTTHKALTRNTAHKAGNAIDEETHGVWIDGPYEINELITGYVLKPKSNLTNKAPHVYFLDIEGFGGFKNANNSEASIKLYQKMSIPFIGLSAVHILMVRESEGLPTFESMFSTIQLSELSTNADVFDRCSLIFGVTRCQKRPFGLMFNKKITRESSDKVSEKFIDHFLKTKNLEKYDVTFRLRCLPNIDPLYPEDYEISCFKEAFDIFAEDIFSLIESASQSGHVRYFQNVMEHFEVLKGSVNTPGFKIDAQRSFKTQMQRTIEKQIEEAINSAKSYVQDRIAKRVAKIDNSKFDQSQWKLKVEKYINRSLEIFNQELLPGILMRPETKDRRDKMQEQISKILSDKGLEIAKKLTPEFLRKADQKAQNYYITKKDELRDKLCVNQYFLDNYNNKSELVTDITEEFRNIMTNTVQEKMTVTQDIEDAIVERIFVLKTLVESDLNLLFKEAESRFTIHKKTVDVDADPSDKTFMIVTIKEFITDPWGNEREAGTDVQRFPINQVYDTRKWYTKVKDFFENLFS